MDNTCATESRREQESNMGSTNSLSSTNLDDGSGLTTSPFATSQENYLPVSPANSSYASRENPSPVSPANKEEPEFGELDDIFGGSDDDEEFQGFRDEDLKQASEKTGIFKSLSGSGDATGTKRKKAGKAVSLPKKKKPRRDVSDDSNQGGVKSSRDEFVSDFDLMMKRKKEERLLKKKRKITDIINDTDNQVSDFIQDMKYASDQDKELHKQEKAAAMKMKILPFVLLQLKKCDLKEVFLNLGILPVIADWLSPLPDGSLPHFSIREGMIRTLAEFAIVDRSLLKSSGVGRAIMFLYNHPEETKVNKERIRRIVAEWSRPDFNVTTSFHSSSEEEEEREATDSNVIFKRRRLNDEEGGNGVGKKRNNCKSLTGEETSLRPGEKACNARSQIPELSTKRYVKKPKSNASTRIGNGSGNKPVDRFQQLMKKVKQKKSAKQRAETVSLDGKTVLY